MRILGIGGSIHDFSAAILQDGEILIAVEDERVNRIKHGRGEWHTTPVKPAVDYCLTETRLTMSDIDYVYSNLHLEKQAYLNNSDGVMKISHHLAHASSAYYPSPFETAALVVMDGAGSAVSTSSDGTRRETISIGTAIKNTIDLELIHSGQRTTSTNYWRYLTADSVGNFYGVVTEALGFGQNGGGKTMGIASYGDSSLYEEMLSFARPTREGGFSFDPYGGLWEWLLQKISESNNPFQIRANLAASSQRILEASVINTVVHAHKRTRQKNLCFAGGCALNSVANGRLLEETPFEAIFIPPAPGDSGTAIGATYYAHYNDLGNRRNLKSDSSIGKQAYTGKIYSKQEIAEALEQAAVSYFAPSELEDEIAYRLLNNEIVAWFNGQSEFGPRALGNRSILANPLTYRIRDTLNIAIKNRETFRPVAPIVVTEEARKYFHVKSESPFMSFVAPVREEFRKRLPAITHVDGTARLQTVDQETNPSIHKLLRCFERLTGYPILVNTSFNVRNQPIVETPEQAIETFLSTPIDTLVLDRFLVEKHTPWAKPAYPRTEPTNSAQNKQKDLP